MHGTNVKINDLRLPANVPS